MQRKRHHLQQQQSIQRRKDMLLLTQQRRLYLLSLADTRHTSCCRQRTCTCRLHRPRKRLPSCSTQRHIGSRLPQTPLQSWLSVADIQCTHGSPAPACNSQQRILHTALLARSILRHRCTSRCARPAAPYTIRHVLAAVRSSSAAKTLAARRCVRAAQEARPLL